MPQTFTPFSPEGGLDPIFNPASTPRSQTPTSYGALLPQTTHGSGPTVEQVHQSALRSIARVVTETVEPTDPSSALKTIAESLRNAPTLVLTGAGVSTGSGIPDYRGPSGSLSRHRPMTYQEFRYDHEASHKYWARSFVGWRLIANAQPNPAHYAIAELQLAGHAVGVVTQNVDRLHQRALASAGPAAHAAPATSAPTSSATPSPAASVVPLHGQLSRVACLRCGTTEDRAHLDQRLRDANPGYLEGIKADPANVNPDGDVTLSNDQVASFRMVGCLACGSERLKPDVVYFGEPVPAERRRAAADLLTRAGSLLVIGSSLAVMSGFRLALDARAQGKPIFVINGGPGRADRKAQVVWRAEVRDALGQLLDELDL